MPTIVVPSPLNAASDTAQGIGQARDLALQRKLQQEQMQKDEQYRTQVLALQQRQTDEAQRVAESEIQSRTLNDTVTREAADMQKQMQPAMMQFLQAQIHGLVDQHTISALTAKADALELKIKQRYGDQEAQMIIQKARADIAATYASAAAARAQAGYYSRSGGRGGGMSLQQLLNNSLRSGDTHELALAGHTLVDQLFQRGATSDEVLMAITTDKAFAHFPEDVKARLIQYAQEHHQPQQPSQAGGSWFDKLKAWTDQQYHDQSQQHQI